MRFFLLIVFREELNIPYHHFDEFLAFSTASGTIGLLLYLSEGLCPSFYGIHDITVSHMVALTRYLVSIHTKPSIFSSYL